MCDFMRCMCMYECVQISLTGTSTSFITTTTKLYIGTYTPHTTQTHNTLHTHTQFYCKITGTSILECLWRRHLWFPGAAPLGIPVLCFFQTKSKKRSSVPLLTQCLHHDALFCFLHLNQSILPQGTAFCINSLVPPLSKSLCEVELTKLSYFMSFYY